MATLANSRWPFVNRQASQTSRLSSWSAAEGYEASTACDAEEALTRLRERIPDLILMDIQLPGRDGLTLTRELKDRPETSAIIILALTSYAMKGDEARARAAGCDGYITKPIDTRTLPTLIARHLQRDESGVGLR